MNDTVPVQPREITDWVYRAARVAGIDDGDAAILARWATGQAIIDTAHVDAILDEPQTALVHARRAEERQELRLTAPPGYAEAMHAGIALPVVTLERLRAAASAFLVPETTLDEIDQLGT